VVYVRAEAKTGWFDSHPSARDRIRHAAAERDEPVFADARPAAILFSDFPAVARGVTGDLYRAVFGSRFQPSKMHSTEELLRPTPLDTPPREIPLD